MNAQDNGGHSMSGTTDEIPVEDGIPADLLAAFEEYERAILANDLDVLDASFAHGAPSATSGDPSHSAGSNERPARLAPGA